MHHPIRGPNPHRMTRSSLHHSSPAGRPKAMPGAFRKGCLTQRAEPRRGRITHTAAAQNALNRRHGTCRHDPGPRRLHRRPCLRDVSRAARRRGRPPGRIPLQGRVLAGRGHRHRSHLHRLLAVPRGRPDRALAAAGMDPPCHRRPDVAGDHLPGRGLCARRHPAHRSSIRSWLASSCGRSPISSPMAISAASSCSARYSPGQCSTASRSSAAAIRARFPIPNGGRRNDVIAVVVGTLLYLALGFWFHPYAIGLRVFGS